MCFGSYLCREFRKVHLFTKSYLNRLTISSFKIRIPNEQDRSELELTVQYHKEYPSTCYPKFTVYAEWLTDEQIADIEETLVLLFLYVIYRWNSIFQIKEMFAYITGWSGFEKTLNLKLFRLSITFHICFIISVVQRHVSVETEKPTEGKTKVHGAPEPLPVKEFLEGAGKNTFIRPIGCVYDRKPSSLA